MQKKNCFKVLRFLWEFADAMVLCIIVSCLFGCTATSKELGFNSTHYEDACEQAPLKLPPDSLAVSKRYDIPDIPGNKDLIIADNRPPDYY